MNVMGITQHKKKNGTITIKKDGKIVGNYSANAKNVPTPQTLNIPSNADTANITETKTITVNDSYQKYQNITQSLDNVTQDKQVLDKNSMKSLETKIKTIFPQLETFNVALHRTSSGEPRLEIVSIRMPKEYRGNGTGTKIMNIIVQHADNNGWKLSLTPDADYGGQKATKREQKRLENWYKTFGFCPNSGRNRDYEISETMIRTSHA